MWTDGVSVRDGRPTQPPGGTKVLPPPLWSPLPGGDPRRSAPPSCPETAPHRSSPSSSPAAPTRTKSRCGRAPPGSSSGPVTQLSLPHIPLMLSGTTPPNPNLNPNWVGDGFQPATFFFNLHLFPPAGCAPPVSIIWPLLTLGPNISMYFLGV